MTGLPPLNDILEEYQLVDAEDRYRLLIDLGRQLEPMPDALKTDARLSGTVTVQFVVAFCPMLAGLHETDGVMTAATRLTVVVTELLNVAVIFAV